MADRIHAMRQQLFDALQEGERGGAGRAGAERAGWGVAAAGPRSTRSHHSMQVTPCFAAAPGAPCLPAQSARPAPGSTSWTRLVSWRALFRGWAALEAPRCLRPRPRLAARCRLPCWPRDRARADLACSPASPPPAGMFSFTGLTRPQVENMTNK